MTVFEAFQVSSYQFLQISRGTVAGNVISAIYNATGVFKLRSQMVRGENAETKAANATLHVRPTEDFIPANNHNLVGHGIRINNQDYEVIGQTGGTNYQTNVIEHYTLTLQETELIEADNGS